MATKDVILSLRTKNGLSQDELAEKVFVTRQAVSRWENGETVPNPDTLKLLSALFDVSINTLLGAPRKLICQCCGMPLEDSLLSREPDGSFNEDYCKWCYADGQFAYQDLQTLTDFLVEHMSNENWSAEQARAYFEAQTAPVAALAGKKGRIKKTEPSQTKCEGSVVFMDDSARASLRAPLAGRRGAARAWDAPAQGSCRRTTSARRLRYRHRQYAAR